MSISSVSSANALTQLYEGLSSDAKPTVGVLPFAKYFESDTGSIYEYSGASWFHVVNGGALSVTTSPSGTSVTPTEENQFSDAATGVVKFNAAASNEVSGLMYVVNPSSYAAARASFRAGTDVDFISRNELVVINSDVAITDIYILGLGSVANTGGYVGSSSFSIMTDGQVDSGHLHFEFSSGDDIKTAVLKLGAGFVATAATFRLNQNAMLHIQGKQ